jgi:hypothetical protein
MSDPGLVLFRVFMMAFVVCFLSAPLIWVLCTPNRCRTDAERLLARNLTLTLAVLTVLSLAAWLGLLLISIQLPPAHPFAMAWHQGWVLFFPLWFALAIPTVRAKNPSPNCGVEASVTLDEPTRTASLVNRQKEPVLQSWEWVIGAMSSVLCVAWIASRAGYPFAIPGDKDPSQVTFLHWLLAFGTFTTLTLLQWLLLRVSIGLSSLEPEPLDSNGSEELVEMYRRHRRSKVRILYWTTGVVLPVFLGFMIGWMVWWPHQSRILGAIGGLGGCMLGLTGGFLGAMMGLQRERINRARAQLDAKGSLA